ncbi:MAG: hypothetical protein GX951_04075 [Mollicutes bacterium]|nr:hypothetical protein [Mollicutes bacterium]
MNNKGQTLALFIIILPLLLLACAVIIDTSLITYNKVKLNSITRTIIKTSIERNDKDDIIKLYNDNNIEYEKIEISFEEGLHIKIEIKIDSLLGKVIGKNYYIIRTSLIGTKEDNVIKIKKG